MQKKDDLGPFTIPFTMILSYFAKALFYLGTSINLIHLSINKKLGLGEPKHTRMRLLMADRTENKLIGIFGRFCDS